MIQTETMLNIADNSGAKKVLMYQSSWWLEKEIRKNWRYY